jgi:Flp pilus assembly pilin Flp
MLRKIGASVMRLVERFRSEKGQALAEYGLILALIATVSIVAATALGLAVSGTFDVVSQCLI